MTEETRNGTGDVRLQEFLKRIEDRGLILFGTGYVAGLWRRTLESRGLWDAVRYCVVSGEPAERLFGDRPVYALEQAPFLRETRPGGELPVLGAAVHETLREEVMPRLEACYPGECRFLYPWLFEAAFGSPGRTEEILLDDLIAVQPRENHWITLRYAALCEYMHGRENTAPVHSFAALRDAFQPARTAAELYRILQGRFSGRQTAEKRLSRFFALADQPERAAILRENPILLDERLRVIDGLHRIALARFLGVSALPCRKAPDNALYDVFFPERNRITPAAQRAAGLSEREMELLRRVREDLQYGNGTN